MPDNIRNGNINGGQPYRHGNPEIPYASGRPPAPQRLFNPNIKSALLGIGRAQLRGDQSERHKVTDKAQRPPEDSRWPDGGGGGDGLQTKYRAKREEREVLKSQYFFSFHCFLHENKNNLGAILKGDTLVL